MKVFRFNLSIVRKYCCIIYIYISPHLKLHAAHPVMEPHFLSDGGSDVRFLTSVRNRSSFDMGSVVVCDFISGRNCR